MLLESEFKRPRDSRKSLPCLVHSGQTIILDREQYQMSNMLQCHWSCNFGKLPFFSILH